MTFPPFGTKKISIYTLCIWSASYAFHLQPQNSQSKYLNTTFPDKVVFKGERFKGILTTSPPTACIKVGRGRQDACVGTWDLGTRDEGLEDIKYGMRGRVGRGRRDVKYRDVGDAGCE